LTGIFFFGIINKIIFGGIYMKYGFLPYEDERIYENHLNLGYKKSENEYLTLNSRYFIKDGKPFIPIMGEFHFARYNNLDWDIELAKIKAGGINTVSSYLFWIYHEEIEGEFDFCGDLDVRKFVKLCQKHGLYVILRIGGWVHAECRNGGFPDWLLKKGFKLRDNNEGYLEKIRIWYGKIFEQIEGLLYKDGGNIIGIQLDNELVNNREHLKKLKEIAIDVGFIVPYYTVTGWNSASGAKIPEDEVIPLFGGYPEAPWTGHTKPLPPSKHFFFTKIRNDSAIGADLIPIAVNPEEELPYHLYPFATCELGGGIQVTHHRRPIISPMDVYALSLVKIACQNNLPGYYMYHGGTHKTGKLSTFNESRATNYPNDYAILSYDFQAPIGEYGQIREHYRLLKLLHLFLSNFQEDFAPMTTTLSDKEVKIDDTTTLRYAMRSDGHRGFIFVNHHQRLCGLDDVYNVEFEAHGVTFPPIDVVGDIAFFMPFNMKLGDSILTYATAQPVCRQGKTYFFAKIPNIKPRFKIDEKVYSGDFIEYNDIKIVVLDFEKAKYLYQFEGKVYLGDNCDLIYNDGKIELSTPGKGYYEWDEGFLFIECEKKPQKVKVSYKEILDETFNFPYDYELKMGGGRKIRYWEIFAEGEGLIEISYVGDVLQIYSDGKLICDDYYFGPPKQVDTRLFCGRTILAISSLKDDCYLEVCPKSDLELYYIKSVD